ncbi:hypothetical protein G6L28_08025 [Agrobacterium larrymoorei]|uniref:PAS domain-containing protein n=1 Tax=Agrobacterium larrymoorei TaxID=160699 RepID=UPI0015725D48|nr:PAS domain-containing protein [Agrobacterium larrymoorei]NTJ42545.1 hypothetical protein [Agrobacterium larrymoorei]
MKTLIGLFWQRYAELKRAVDRNEADKIAILDRELDNLLENITVKKNASAAEILEQFRFAIDLLNEEAEDIGCVQRNSDMLRKLVDRYIGAGLSYNGDGEGGVSPYVVLDEDRLDDSDDRVVVVAPGYRINYTNSANASSLGTNANEIVGKHIAEFVGIHHFQHAFRQKLDACFKGEAGKYTYAEDVDGQTIVKSFDMSPCYSPSYKLVGAIIVVKELADRRSRAVA